MGSRSPLPDSLRDQQGLRENSPHGDAGSAALSASGRLLGRIAAALDIPGSVLVAAPNAVSGEPGSDPQGLRSGAIQRECVELIQAFSRIADPAERRRLLAAVREVADRDRPAD